MRSFFLASLVFVVVVSIGAPAYAGGKRVRYQAIQQSAPAPVDSGDYCEAFQQWINQLRGQRGLQAIGHDPNLTAWAAQNNYQQAARGVGHFVMGTARRQNSGMGAFQAVCPMWVASPAHASALFDPTIRYFGIHRHGLWWTFSAY